LRHLAADQAQIQAAGTGFVADANDVSGNNIPPGGGSYVGDATTVAARPRSPALPRARSRLRAPRRERQVLSPKAAVLVVAADKPAISGPGP
jgi:hypothetical protein